MNNEVMREVILKPGKEKSLLRFHPWIFSGAIAKIPSNPIEGEFFTILSSEAQFLAIGFYQKGSIAFRVVSFANVPLDISFWKKKLQSAIDYRIKCGLFNNPQFDCFRLIHGEGDGFPGLICDWYNGVVVMQAHASGMYLLLPSLAEIIKELLPNDVKAIYNKSEHSLAFVNGEKTSNHWMYGEEKEVTVHEYGVKYVIDIEGGQKTGFFLDQRENRKLLMQYVNGKKVLNTFSYSGGFSLAAIQAGAAFAQSVDSSAKAIELCERNARINEVDSIRHQAICEDVMAHLQSLDNSFEVMIVDPPAYAKHLDAVDHALKGYIRLNRRAMEKISKPGILFTFSCSQVVSAVQFRQAVFSAGVQAGIQLKVLHQLHQPADHPVNLYHPEGEYLKGLVLYVD